MLRFLNRLSGAATGYLVRMSAARFFDVQLPVDLSGSRRWL